MESQTSIHDIVGPKFDPTSSKYDYVKVRVWIDDHYYILSRFLICRYLMVTKVSHDDSIKISLELKKALVDAEKFDVKHSDMEETLFVILRNHGYDESCISKFKLMTKFHHLRIPLVVLISGTGCVGKSTLATQLSERLNLPSVLQTDLVYEVMKSLRSENFDLHDTPIWYRQFNTDKEFIKEFKRECQVIRKGVEGEIQKCLEEGKSIIVEGSHLDLALYVDMLGLDRKKDETAAKEGLPAPSPLGVPAPSPLGLPAPSPLGLPAPSPLGLPAPSPLEAAAAASAQPPSLSLPAASMDIPVTSPSAKSETPSKPKPFIVVPFLITADDSERMVFLENYLRSSGIDNSPLGQTMNEQRQTLVHNFAITEKYLEQHAVAQTHVIRMSVRAFPKALETLQDVVVGKIQKMVQRTLAMSEKQPKQP